jgi:hypothetical protein
VSEAEEGETDLGMSQEQKPFLSCLARQQPAYIETTRTKAEKRNATVSLPLCAEISDLALAWRAARQAGLAAETKSRNDASGHRGHR